MLTVLFLLVWNRLPLQFVALCRICARPYVDYTELFVLQRSASVGHGKPLFSSLECHVRDRAMYALMTAPRKSAELSEPGEDVDCPVPLLVRIVCKLALPHRRLCRSAG